MNKQGTRQGGGGGGGGLLTTSLCAYQLGCLDGLPRIQQSHSHRLGSDLCILGHSLHLL